jgi:peptidylprolyl isomerase
MKTRHIILIMLGTMLVTGIGIAVGYYLNQRANQDNVASESKAILESKTPTAGSLRVQGDNSVASGALLEPDQFFQYEDYANSAGSLFQDIVVGDGTELATGDTANVIYTGWLTNGQVFDQSVPNESGELQSFEFTLGAGQVIPGWEQSVLGMKVGGKRRLIIPSQFGYGTAESANIPANSMLVFDVELVQVEKGNNGFKLGL